MPMSHRQPQLERFEGTGVSVAERIIGVTKYISLQLLCESASVKNES